MGLPCDRVRSETSRTDIRGGDDPVTGLVVSCAGHEEPPQLWPISVSESTASVSSLGAQTRKLADDGVRILPAVEEVLRRHQPQNAVVVGHTDCSVVKDGYETYLRGTEPPNGVALRTAPILSLVEEAVESGDVGGDVDRGTAVHRLVEQNVARQTVSLSRELGDDVTVAGYVHDRNGVYTEESGGYRLVALDEDTDPERIRSDVPGTADVDVSTLL